MRHKLIPRLITAVHVATAPAAESPSFRPLFRDISGKCLSRFPFQSLPRPLPRFPLSSLFGVWSHIVLISFIMNMGAYNIKTILFKEWEISDFPPIFFLLSAGFHSSLILCFICHLKWQVGLEMRTLFPMLFILYGFLWSYKDKDNHSSFFTA